MENTQVKTAITTVAVIGGGSWATAIVKILSEQNLQINWWLRNSKDAAFIRKFNQNPSYLSDVEINPDKVTVTTNILHAIETAEVVFLVVPAAFMTDALKDLPKNYLQNKIIVSAVKGMIPERNLLITEYVAEDFGVLHEKIAIIAGPCHAEEVALERQSYLTIASENTQTAQIVANLLTCAYIKATPFGDIYGVEYSAIIKNIVALTCGIAHGLGYGDNFQAVLVSNAMKEIENFIQALRPMPRNLAQTAYLGDLLVTAYSQFSRNRTFGNMIGRGYTVQSAQMEMNMIAEGYYAVKSIYAINEKHNADLPITTAAYRILYEKASAKREIDVLRKIFV